MRYYGTITGKIRGFGTQRVYQEGEKPEDWNKYEFEIKDVRDEEGNTYGTKFARVSLKTALRMENLIVSGNLISFDCSGIEGDIILKIRNWCTSLTGVGRIDVANPFAWSDYFNLKEYNDFFKESNVGLNCVDCKYRNNKKLCSKYKV